MGRMLQDVVRLDVVWSVYRDDNTSIPVNWKNFIRLYAKKDGRFKLLANVIQEFQPPHRKQIIFTRGQNPVSSPMSYLSDLYFTQLIHGSCFKVMMGRLRGLTVAY